MALPPAEETDIGEKATKAANAAVQHQVTRKGKDVTTETKMELWYAKYCFRK